ncbi:MAG: HAD family hydrolase [Clostridiales bacterium]|nr:HAD family hydrolase [Clostridiales bacterium]
MIRSVVFDVGGTMHVSLKDPDRVVAFSVNVLGVLSNGGIPLDVMPEKFYASLQRHAEEYKEWSEQSGRELPGEQIWGDYYLKPYHVDKEKLKPLAEELSFLYDDARVCNIPRPNLLETIRAIHAMGIKTGVISNIISLAFVPTVLKRYGIAEYMSCVVLSSAVGIRKPQPGIFQAAERELGLASSELAYVGDTISRDVIGARNAGWRLMIQIKNPSTEFRDRNVKGSGFVPDYLIDGLDEIPGIISRENKKDEEGIA